MPQVKPKLKSKPPKPKRVATKVEPELLGWDTETSGVDLHHGASVYYLSTCDEDDNQLCWQWDVDPLTRKPIIPKQDLADVRELLFNSGYRLVAQNQKFDVTAISTILDDVEFPWSNSEDTLIAGHLLASNQPHDLTSMSLIYLGINLKPYEDRLEVATKEARALAKKMFPNWMIAKAGMPEMPSAKVVVWKNDGWLPRALAKELDYPKDHHWWTVLSEYANPDSAVVVPLFKAMKEQLEDRGLWKIYKERMRLPGVLQEMEGRGVTTVPSNTGILRKRIEEEMAEAEAKCKGVAASYGIELELPKGGTSKALHSFVFETLKLEPFSKSKKTGAASLDKHAIAYYTSTLPTTSKSRLFFSNLSRKRKRDTALSYLESYGRFILDGKLYPSINPTGTDTLRCSSSNPNSQNIGKGDEDRGDPSLRFMFGPEAGREWWSKDYSNLELVIPAYDSGETKMIELFEHPDDPPYFGSVHLLNFSIVYPKEWKQYGAGVKKKYPVLYGRVKAGDFAVQYGAVAESGTADRAFGVKGAQAKIEGSLQNIKKLSQKQIEFANEHGYVETIPDKTVDPEHGYPLLCTRSKWGKVLPTVPLSYHIQGTAMWITCKAMVRCDEYLKKLRVDKGIDAFMTLQIHDEIVFDFPKGVGKEPWKTNLPYVKQLGRLMEQSGDDIGIPIRTSITYHPNNWSEGLSI